MKPRAADDDQADLSLPLLADTEGSTNDVAAATSKKPEKKSARFLALLFCGMVFVGLGNKIFSKLMTQPMHNYPFFLSVYSTFIYLPTSFAYIIPAIIWTKWISKEERKIPQKNWAIMGGLDGISGVMSTFAITNLPGSFVILLQQSAIPVSMILSYFLLKTRYKVYQYAGAVVVIGGILVVLGPSFAPQAHSVTPSGNFSGNGTAPPADSSAPTYSNIPVWALVMMLSCIPMTLSSVYKERVLGDVECDVVYLNGWIGVWQLLLTLPMAVPAAPTCGITISEIPTNFFDGMKCYAGENSQPSDDCKMSVLLVNVYLMFNIGYNILIIMILKHGSANTLWLALTVMVPLGNIAFTLPFVPGNRPLELTDIIGLVVIMVGLCSYRFGGAIAEKLGWSKEEQVARESENHDVATKKSGFFVGVNQAEIAGTVIDYHEQVLYVHSYYFCVHNRVHRSTFRKPSLEKPTDKSEGKLPARSRFARHVMSFCTGATLLNLVCRTVGVLFRAAVLVPTCHLALHYFFQTEHVESYFHCARLFRSHPSALHPFPITALFCTCTTLTFLYKLLVS
jgi:drug/metabolite transporter (DMT)-like permease